MQLNSNEKIVRTLVKNCGKVGCEGGFYLENLKIDYLITV